MDKASLIGIIVGVVCLGICAYEVSHGHFMMFYSLEGILMVGGGSRPKARRRRAGRAIRA